MLNLFDAQYIASTGTAGFVTSDPKGALANKMARTIWALLLKQEDYRTPVVVAA